MNYKELKKDVEQKLKEIIKTRLKVDLDKDNRRPATTVLARMIYTKVLRDDGYTWASIAFSINRNHSTVIYQYKALDDVMYFDKVAERKYLEIKNLYFEEEDILDFQTVGELKKTIKILTNDNKLLISRIKELESKH